MWEALDGYVVSDEVDVMSLIAYASEYCSASDNHLASRNYLASD